MFPPFYTLCEASSAVKAVFGNNPRIFPHGIADQNTTKPYAVQQIITGFPENYLGDRPDTDNYDVQVDVYAKTVAEAANGAKVIRDAVEGAAHVTAWRGQFKDPDTSLYRYSFEVSFVTYRI